MKMYTLAEILHFEEVPSAEGMPTWANLKARPKPSLKANPTDLAGGGVYACFWKGGLIYIGEFVSDDDNPLGGHVVDRIQKHAAGFVLRDHRLFFNRTRFQKILEFGGPISDDLRQANAEVITKDRGVCATPNKVRFAETDWQFIKQAGPTDILEHFSFGYQRITPPSDQPMPSAEWIKRNWVEPIEKVLIGRLNPICNKLQRTGPDGPRYSPDEVASAFQTAFAEAKYPPENKMAA